jgi:Ca2+-binding EF-hand superfamily protein
MDHSDVCERLYRMPRHSEKPPKTANDALISDLPADTIRWIKNRRRLDCDAKMVLSHHREHQLRDIFNGIDVGNNGSIDLEELGEAVSFVSERLKNRIGSFKGFNKVLDIFSSMDDNGDGQVDFQEFTNAMSGSAKSALDKASEQDIANLHRCFLEFGVMKSRRYAIAKINEYTGLSFAGENATNFKSAFEEEQREKAKKNSGTVDDLKQYQLFRTLFEEKRDIGSLVKISSVEDAKPGEEEKEKKYTLEEIMLKEFQEENRRMHLNGTADPAKEAEYDALHERLRQAREHEAMLLARDPDNLLLHMGHKESLK